MACLDIVYIREAMGGFGRHGRLPPKLFIFSQFLCILWGLVYMHIYIYIYIYIYI
jgi:hypothetical protein